MPGFAFAALCTILTAGMVSAQGGSIIDNGDFGDGTRGWDITQGETCVPSVVDCELPEIDKALRLQLDPREGDVTYALRMEQRLGVFIDEGDRLELKLWARSPDSCRANAYVQQAADPWPKFLQGMIEATPQWQELTLTGAADRDYSPGETAIGFHFSYSPGTLEIAGLRLANLDATDDPLRRRPTMDDPIPLIENGDFAQGLEGWTGADGQRLKATLIDVDVEGYTKGVRLECRPVADQPPYQITFRTDCTAAITPRDAVYFRAWMRSPDSITVAFIHELAGPPHTKSIRQTVRLTPEWAEYRFVGFPDRGFAPEESQALWYLGYGAGAVEIAGVRVENYGQADRADFDETIDWWGGREHPDDWRQPALERIEQIRKSELTVRVVDADGEPIEGATVTVKQQRHHFRFGTAAPAGRFVDTANPDNLRFQQEVERLYNVITFENDLKWPGVERMRMGAVDGAIEWLAERDIDVRGHCLLWGSYNHLPGNLRELRGDELLQAMKDHVADYVTTLGDRLYLWDVVNEAGSNVEVWDEVGWEHFADSFRWAREANPNVALCYNDYGILRDDPYKERVAERIRFLLDNDSPVDVLGLQAHMNTPLVPIHRVLEILDEWADFGLPLEITEFDIGCFDDEAHGEYVRDFVIAAYSHPAVESFIMWGFWAGSHWRARDGAAMFRIDWTPRPAQEAWENLVLSEWWTNETGSTNADGELALRAFHGKHAVTVEAAGRRAEAEVELLPGEGAVAEVVVR